MKINKICIVISLVFVLIASIGLVSASELNDNGDLSSNIEVTTIDNLNTNLDNSDDIDSLNTNLDNSNDIENISEKQDAHFNYTYSSSITYKQDLVFKIKSSDNLTGKARLIIDNNRTLNGTFSKGITAFFLERLTAGNHSLQFDFYDDINYNDYSEIFNITVYKADPEDMTITVYNNDDSEIVTYGDKAKVIVKFTEDETGNIFLRLDDGEWHNLVIFNQNVSYIFEDLKAGIHTVYINYSGDNNFNNGTLSKTFEIVKKSLNNETINISNPVIAEYNLQVAFPIDATGNVTVIYNGKEYNSTVLYGVSAVPISDFIIGEGQTVNIKYSGDDNYNPADLDLVINVESCKVNTTITVNDLNIDIFDSKYLLINLKNSEGKALAGDILNIRVGDNNYTLVTDSNGQVKFLINPTTMENLTVNINFAGDKFNYPSSASAKIIVNKMTTSITASNLSIYRFNTKNLVLTLKDAKGKVLSNKEVSITINGKVYNVTTSSNGQASLPIHSSKVKNYTTTIDFAGDDNYAGSSKSVVVIIKKAQVTVNDIIKAASTLKNYAAKKKKLPSSMMVGSINCTSPRLSYLMTVAIKCIYKNKKLTTKITVLDVNAKNYNRKVSLKILKNDYLKIVNGLYNKGVKGQLPKYFKKNGKIISFNVYTYSLSKILAYYKKYSKLPTSCVFASY